MVVFHHYAEPNVPALTPLYGLKATMWRGIACFSSLGRQPNAMRTHLMIAHCFYRVVVVTAGTKQHKKLAKEKDNADNGVGYGGDYSPSPHEIMPTDDILDRKQPTDCYTLSNARTSEYIAFCQKLSLFHNRVQLFSCISQDVLINRSSLVE